MLLLLTLRPACALPISKSAADYTMTITGAEWTIPTQWRNWEVENGLLVHYKLTDAAGNTVDLTNRPQNYLQARIYSPAHLDASQATRFVGDGAFASVDPGGAEYRVDFVLTDPNATDQSIGQSSSTAVFGNVPLPTAYSVDTPVGTDYTTALGTDITLKTVRLDEPGPGNPAASYLLTLTFSVHPSSTASGIIVSAGGSVQLQYENGATWKGRAPQASGANNLTLTVPCTGAPIDRRHPLGISIPVTEQDVAMRDPAHYLHFGFVIPARDIRMSTVASAVTGSTSTQAGSAAVTIGGKRQIDQGYCEYPVWLSETTLGSNQEWQITNSIATFPGGATAIAAVRRVLYWRLDGSRPPGQTTGAMIGVRSPANPPEAASKDTLTLQAAIRSEFEFNYGNLTIPAPGAKIMANRKPDDNPSSRVTLVSIENLKGEHPSAQAKSLGAGALLGGALASGLVCVFHVDPAAEAGLTLYNVQALDDQNLCLLPNPASVNLANRIDGPEMAFVVNPPSANASTFTLTMHAIRLAPQGDPITATVPLPQ